MEKEKWAKTLNEFFQDKKNIAHVFMLADSRHDPTEDDLQMTKYLHFYTLPFSVILTKVDKLSKMKIKEHTRAIAADLYLGESNMIATSAETGYGKMDVLKKIRAVIDAAKEAPYQDNEDGEDFEETAENNE